MSLGLGLIEAIGGNQLAVGKMAQAIEVAPVQMSLLAALFAGVALGLQPRLGLLQPGLLLDLPQAHEHLTRLDPLALGDQQLGNLAADIEGQMRAPTGLQRTRAGVGHQRLHRPALNLQQPDRQRLWSTQPAAQHHQTGQHRRANQ
ncbi:hypothetical protein D3C78_571330 [compost metagenome]